MTNQDLRAKYKKDTGIYADASGIDYIDLDNRLTIEELSQSVEVKVEIELEDIPYLIWLEEQLIINLK